MIIKEDQCCDCGLPCLGSSCPMKNAVVSVCDNCGEYAQYRVDGKDWCEDCLSEMFDEVFTDLSIHDKAAALDYYCEEIT